jgi:NADPH-dependent 7-cyano-7-deazaguanine reductase QueF
MEQTLSPHDRRRLLAAVANPQSDLDYLVTLRATLALRLSARPPERVSLSLRYIPDRLLIERQSFTAYLQALEMQPHETLEAMALAVLNDVNNEIVPRLVQLRAGVLNDAESLVEESVWLEDRQPRFANESLIARLPPG